MAARRSRWQAVREGRSTSHVCSRKHRALTCVSISEIASRSHSSLGIFDLDLLPGLVGIERPHADGNGFGPLAQILLVDLPRMIDEEGHHARIAIFGGI